MREMHFHSLFVAPFCLSFYLDLVKTPTGALIWSFLKPMLLGEILYTPDTPETQAIMEKVMARQTKSGNLVIRKAVATPADPNHKVLP